MLRHRPALMPQRRRGFILLVVLGMLTLFAAVGLAFVFYATASQESAHLNLEGQSLARPDVDPELLFSYFLGQLLFDVPDDETGIYSALRGHSLSRNMLGMNYQLDSTGKIRTNANGELVDGQGNVLN